jgi:hypothetical protein
MIYISLERNRIRIVDRRKVWAAMSALMPLILVINKMVGALNKRQNLNCNISIEIGNVINLEVKK